MLDTKTLLRETQERIAPPKDVMGSLERRRRRRDRNRRVAAGILGIAVFALAAIGFARLLGSEPTPASDPRSPFLGVWVSTSDTDGGTRRMTVQVVADDAVEIAMLDELDSACSGGPSTMTGTGRVRGGTQLVIPSPVSTCDDGSEPQAATGAPLEEQLRNLTFVLDPAAETLTDDFGQVWTREGARDASPERIISSQAWPQSTLEEAQVAQELADAGDPDYAWQLGLDVGTPGDELFMRFLRERLGWEEFLKVDDAGGQRVYVRCAPGRTNPLYPNDPDVGGCAPTIDRFRYETVKINVSQALHNGPSGIWVVTAWARLQPSDAPLTDVGDYYLLQQQVEQVAPPSDAEATAFLNAFLQARVAGEGAARYLHPQAEQVVAESACSVHTSASCAEIPLLYATTSGAPYERFEFELVWGPAWPDGRMVFDVRLFAEGGRSVVGQQFVLVRGADGRLGLLHETGTTQNGEAVGLPFELLDGEVTLLAPRPWYEFFDFGPGTMALTSGDLDGDLSVLADPLPVGTGCEPGAAAADAETLAQSVLSDPDLEATGPVAVSVGGTTALRMDVAVAAGASVCDSMGTPLVLRAPSEGQSMGPSLGGEDRMRLYLLDLPEGSSARILAIAITAPQASFEQVLDAAAPIVDSVELHAR